MRVLCRTVFKGVHVTLHFFHLRPPDFKTFYSPLLSLLQFSSPSLFHRRPPNKYNQIENYEGVFNYNRKIFMKKFS